MIIFILNIFNLYFLIFFHQLITLWWPGDLFFEWSWTGRVVNFEVPLLLLWQPRDNLSCYLSLESQSLSSSLFLAKRKMIQSELAWIQTSRTLSWHCLSSLEERIDIWAHEESLKEMVSNSLRKEHRLMCIYRIRKFDLT